MSKNYRLAAFGTLWVILASQAAFAVRVLEPYPALIMPAFAGAADESDNYPVNRLEIIIEYKDQSPAHPSAADFMTGFRFSSVAPSMKYMFHPEGAGASSGRLDDPDLLSWIRERGREVGEGHEPTSIEFCWQKGVLDIADATVTNLGHCESLKVEL